VATSPERDDRAAARVATNKWKARADAARRQILSPALLRPLLHERLRTFQARRGPAPHTEEQFLNVSPAYRSALADRATLSEGVARTVIDGFRWCSPLPVGDKEPEPEGFPCRGILQTRELAIGGVMLDIGANTGMMSIPRVVLGDVTMAYCCEPDPLTFACLVANVVDNGLRGAVLPDQTAIGDRDGLVHLRRVGASGGFYVVPAAGADTVEVPCVTLDGWIDRLLIDRDAVTFIKVDVEGFEQRLLAGASRTLTHRHIVWQMEIKPSYLRAVGDSLGSLCETARRAFTHFIDLNRHAAGPRIRPVDELAAGLAYVDQKGKTDVLLFNDDHLGNRQ
jgi:FkbM family methyltransferase